jgi:parallel beta helix pectate lyase-like protein
MATAASPLNRTRNAILALTLAFWGFEASAAASDVSRLQSLLDAAAPGDTIETGPGDFGRVVLKNYTFSPPVTIKFHADASIQRLRLDQVTGVTFDGIQVIAGETDRPKGDNAVLVLGGGAIAFLNAQFQWSNDANPLNDGTALAFDKVDGLTVANSHFSHSFNGVVVRSSQNAFIRDSSFTAIPKDGMVISGTGGVIIDGNTCRDFTHAPGKDLHPDCIQLQAGGRGVANQNVIISNNKAIRGAGARFQGIFVKSRHANAPHIGVTIENNYVEQSMGLGIAAINTRDLIIRGNEVRPANSQDEAPRILVREPAGNVLVEDNIASGVKAPPGARVFGNTILD